MSGPSPTCVVSDNGGAYVSTTNGVNVGAADAIAVQLANAAGVFSWTLSVIGTDDLSSTPTITLSGTGNNTRNFTAGALGSAYILQSVVNGGVDTNGVPQPSYTTTLGVYVLAANGQRVMAVNERFEGSALFGWTTKYNALARGVLTAGANPRSSGAVGDGVTDDHAAFVTANALATLTGTALNLTSGTYSLGNPNTDNATTGLLPTALPINGPNINKQYMYPFAGAQWSASVRYTSTASVNVTAFPLTGLTGTYFAVTASTQPNGALGGSEPVWSSASTLGSSVVQTDGSGKTTTWTNMGAPGADTLNYGVVSCPLSLKGSLYTSVPSVVIGPPGIDPTTGLSGVQATAVATVTDGVVTGIIITNPGTLYSPNFPPTVTIGAPGGGGITATVTAGNVIVGWPFPRCVQVNTGAVAASYTVGTAISVNGNLHTLQARKGNAQHEVLFCQTTGGGDALQTTVYYDNVLSIVMEESCQVGTGTITAGVFGGQIVITAAVSKSAGAILVPQSNVSVAFTRKVSVTDDSPWLDFSKSYVAATDYSSPFSFPPSVEVNAGWFGVVSGGASGQAVFGNNVSGGIANSGAVSNREALQCAVLSMPGAGRLKLPSGNGSILSTNKFDSIAITEPITIFGDGINPTSIAISMFIASFATRVPSVPSIVLNGSGSPVAGQAGLFDFVGAGGGGGRFIDVTDAFDQGEKAIGFVNGASKLSVTAFCAPDTHWGLWPNNGVGDGWPAVTTLGFAICASGGSDHKNVSGNAWVLGSAGGHFSFTVSTTLGAVTATAAAAIVPGHTYELDGSYDATAIGKVTASGGSGWTTGMALTASGGGGSGWTGTAIASGGALTGVTITTPGTGYATLPTISGGGTGGTFTPTLGAVYLWTRDVTAATSAVLAIAVQTGTLVKLNGERQAIGAAPGGAMGGVLNPNFTGGATAILDSVQVRLTPQHSAAAPNTTAKPTSSADTLMLWICDGPLVQGMLHHTYFNSTVNGASAFFNFTRGINGSFNPAYDTPLLTRSSVSGAALRDFELRGMVNTILAEDCEFAGIINAMICLWNNSYTCKIDRFITTSTFRYGICIDQDSEGTISTSNIENGNFAIVSTGGFIDVVGSCINELQFIGSIVLIDAAIGQSFGHLLGAQEGAAPATHLGHVFLTNTNGGTLTIGVDGDSNGPGLYISNDAQVRVAALPLHPYTPLTRVTAVPDNGILYLCVSAGTTSNFTTFPTAANGTTTGAQFTDGTATFQVLGADSKRTGAFAINYEGNLMRNGLLTLQIPSIDKVPAQLDVVATNDGIPVNALTLLGDARYGTVNGRGFPWQVPVGGLHDNLPIGLTDTITLSGTNKAPPQFNGLTPPPLGACELEIVSPNPAGFTLNNQVASSTFSNQIVTGGTAMQGLLSASLSYDGNINQWVVKRTKLMTVPQLLSVSPAIGSEAGSTTHNLVFNTGSAITSVHFGANSATIVSGSGTNTLTVTAPAGTASATPVLVKGNDGVHDSSTCSYWYTPSANAFMFYGVRLPGEVLASGLIASMADQVPGSGNPALAQATPSFQGTVALLGGMYALDCSSAGLPGGVYYEASPLTFPQPCTVFTVFADDFPTSTTSNAGVWVCGASGPSLSVDVKNVPSAPAPSICSNGIAGTYFPYTPTYGLTKRTTAVVMQTFVNPSAGKLVVDGVQIGTPPATSSAFSKLAWGQNNNHSGAAFGGRILAVLGWSTDISATTGPMIISILQQWAEQT